MLEASAPYPLTPPPTQIGKTALDILREENKHDLAKLLEQVGEGVGARVDDSGASIPECKPQHHS